MEDVYDDFVAQLTERAKDLRPGDPAEAAEGTFSPLSSRAAAETACRPGRGRREQGRHPARGRRARARGRRRTTRPAVLTGITEEMRAYREELFGPVAVVYSVSSDDEALTLANDSDYGLGGAVFSTDTERARKVAERLEVGMSNVNTPAGEGAEVPFGGVKRSGFGRELGPAGHGRVRQQADVLRR